ncbi:MAG: hypothetical protein PHI64_01735 [Zoogloea sp.]|uniref:hypothetical protein n=1 Tax=Zoogloea sp. TaxID=49181 RepID=UPI00261451E5|nr:hypothetical protein [Zoogloea sp.]MDD2987658.1 hypothetical protein [Zoogloea sp.]
MFQPHYQPSPRPLRLAIAFSLLVHALALLIHISPPPQERPEASPLQARLAPVRPARKPPAETRPAPPPTPSKARQVKPPPKEPRPQILTARKNAAPTVRAAEPTPRWSVAQKQEMDNFLNELATEAKARPKPDLAERSMAMARDIAREAGRDTHERPQDGGSRRRSDLTDLIERIPDSPPVDPFSLEFYMDALVKKLNRSASFVKNDPRARGMHSAAVEVRLNPDGSLKSFKVVNAGDQQEEIAFVKSVVERAVPFAAFPPDIGRSARSLALMICIQPTGLGGDGFGFTRRPEGSRC